MKKRVFSYLLVLVLIFGLIGCTTKPNDKKLHIAVAIPPLAAFVNAVGGEYCSVQILIPPGYSPETYSSSPKELAKAQNASAYFSAGLPMEEQAILPHLNADTQVVFLDQKTDEVYSPLMMGTTPDPHRWLSPKRAQVMTMSICDALSELDPKNASVYEQNAKTFLDELVALDEELKTILAPVENRSFIVYHPAFGYFAQDYNLDMIALQKDGKEATQKYMQDLLTEAKAEGNHVIFYQEEIDSRQAEAFARELSGEAVALSPLSEDYCNNLRQMATAIREALGT